MTMVRNEIPATCDVRSVRDLPYLGGTVYDLVSQRSGARHIHLAVDDANNYFCVLYRTPPPDSTGVPHIMEHCVSGGSRRFPPGAGGDMYNRSLLTDINGTTQADNTSYYFATRNPIDYFNWLEYVVDVSLFPILAEDTFLKHRGHFEFAMADDPTSKLRFVGTVFNEMKAVFGSPTHHEFLAVRRSLFDPEHPYAKNSGGDPADMPHLTYEGLRSFNTAHYHPGNATFVSRGDGPLDKIVAACDEIVGDTYERREPSVIPDVAQRRGPRAIEAPYAAAADAHPLTTIAWLAAPSLDRYTALLLDVANDLLLSNQVRRAVEDVGALTSRVAPFLRMMVVLSIAGASDDATSRVLESLASDIDQKTFDDAVARLELVRREQSNALGTFLQGAYPAALYDGDAGDVLDFEPLAARASLDDFRAVVERELITNPHRVDIVLRPDPDLETRVRETEERWLTEVESSLTDERRKEIIATTARLTNATTGEFAKRGLTNSEGRTELSAPAGETSGPVTRFEARTAGLTYIRVRVDLSGLPDELIPNLRLFGDACVREAKRIASRVDAISATTHSRTDPSGTNLVHWLEFGARALDRDAHELTSIVAAMLRRPDTSNVQELVSQAMTDLERSVMPDAQRHLRRLSSSSLRRSGRYDDDVRGVSQITFLRNGAFALDEIAARIFTPARITACLISEGDTSSLGEGIADIIGGSSGEGTPTKLEDRIDEPRPHRARVAQLPVAFTCETHTIGGLDDPDVPAIAVLFQQLFAGHLNTEIRRGGAYGVDYGVLPGRGIAWISSRRDPLPDNSYKAIDDALRRMSDGSWDGPSADESKLPILRTTDPVDSPVAASRRAWNASFTGQSTDLWNNYRMKILDVTDEDTARVARTGFTQPSRATLAGQTLLDGTGPYDEIEEP